MNLHVHLGRTPSCRLLRVFIVSPGRDCELERIRSKADRYSGSSKGIRAVFSESTFDKETGVVLVKKKNL